MHVAVPTSLRRMLLSLSQCRTVCVLCCDGDTASQLEMAIFGVSDWGVNRLIKNLTHVITSET